eukprot:COSAG02_NODE_51819_length_311_cov_1.466981_2_plen_41_part_01
MLVGPILLSPGVGKDSPPPPPPPSHTHTERGFTLFPGGGEG